MPTITPTPNKVKIIYERPFHRALCVQCKWSYAHERREIAHAHGHGHRQANGHEVSLFNTDGRLVDRLVPSARLVDAS